MFFTILLLLNFTRHIKKHLLVTKNFITFQERTVHNNNTGEDRRFLNNINVTKNNITYEEELYNIIILHKKKRLLDILQDDKVSIVTKCDLINSNSNSNSNNISTTNLFAGGLLKDWDF